MRAAQPDGWNDDDDMTSEELEEEIEQEEQPLEQQDNEPPLQGTMFMGRLTRFLEQVTQPPQSMEQEMGWNEDDSLGLDSTQQQENTIEPEFRHAQECLDTVLHEIDEQEQAVATKPIDTEDALSDDAGVSKLQKDINQVNQSSIAPIVDQVPVVPPPTSYNVSLDVMFESDDRTRDTGIDDDEVVFGEENEWSYGPVVDHTPTRSYQQKSASVAVVALPEPDDLDEGWEDDELNIVEDEEVPLNEPTMVDHTPGEEIETIGGNPSVGVLVSSVGDDTTDILDKEDLPTDAYGLVVDHTPTVATNTTVTDNNTNSLAVNAGKLQEDFERDDEMDETCFDSIIEQEEEWGEDEIVEKDLGTTTVNDESVPVSTGRVEVEEKDEKVVVDCTPSEILSSHAESADDPSIKAIATEEDLTRDTGEGNDEDIYDDENEIEFRPVVDHTPKTPRQHSRSMSGTNSMAVNASGLEEDFRDDDAMDETAQAELDKWEEDDDIQIDEKEVILDQLSTNDRPPAATRNVALVDHTPSEMGTAIVMKNTEQSLSNMSEEGATKDDEDDQSRNDDDNAENFGPVVDHTPQTPATSVYTRSDSVVVQIQAQDLATVDECFSDDSTVNAGSLLESHRSSAVVDESEADEGDDEFPSELRSLDAQLVDHVPQRPESRFGDASTLVVADPSELMSEVDDMAQEEGDFGPVVDVTPPTRSGLTQPELPSGAASTVVFAPPSVAADDLDDADETEGHGGDNGWDHDDVDVEDIEEEPNPQSGNEEHAVPRVVAEEQVVDFLPTQDGFEDTDGPSSSIHGDSSEVAIGGAQSLLPQDEPKEDDFGPVVDQTPHPGSVMESAISTTSLATQLTLSECRAMEKEDIVDGLQSLDDDAEEKIFVDHLPQQMRDIHGDSIATVGRSQLSDEEEEYLSQFGPVVDQLPTSRASLAPSRGGSTVDALATVSEVDSDDEDEQDGEGWGDEDVDLEASLEAVSDKARSRSESLSRPSLSVSNDQERNVSVRFDASVDDRFNAVAVNDTQYYDTEMASTSMKDDTRYYDPQPGCSENGWDGDNLDIEEGAPDYRFHSALSDSFANAETPPSTPYRRQDVLPHDDPGEDFMAHLSLEQLSLSLNSQCQACNENQSVDCPCVQKILWSSDNNEGIIGSVLTPEGDKIQVDFAKVLKMEIMKRRVVEEELKQVMSRINAGAVSSPEDAKIIIEQAKSNDSLTQDLRSQSNSLKEKSSLSRQVQGISETVQPLEGEKYELSIRENSRQRSDDDGLKEELTAKTNECVSLEADVSRLVKQVASMRNGNNSEIDELKGQLHDCEIMLAESRSERENSSAQMKGYETSYESKVKQLETQLHEIRGEKNELSNQLTKIQVQHEDELQQQYDLLDNKTLKIRELEASIRKLQDEKLALLPEVAREKKLADESESLANELLSVAKERDLLQDALIESKEAIASLQKHIDEYGMEEEEFRTKRDLELASLKEEMKTMRTETIKKEKELLASKSELKTLSAEVESVQASLIRIKDENQSLETRVEHGKLLLYKEEEKYQRLVEENGSLRKQNSSLLSERQHMESEKNELSRQVEDLKFKLNESKIARQISDDREAGIRLEIEEQAKLINDLSEEKRKTGSEKDELNKKYQALEEKLKKTVDGLKDKEKLQDSLVKQIDELQTELDDNIRQKDELMYENEEMLVQFGLLKEEMDKIEEHARKLEEEISKMRHQTGRSSPDGLEPLRVENERLRLNIENITIENVAKDNELQDMHKQTSDLLDRLNLFEPDASQNQKLRKLEMHINEKDDLISQLRKEIDALHQQLDQQNSSQDDDASTLHQKLQDAERSIMDKHDQIRMLEAHIASIEEERETAKQKSRIFEEKASGHIEALKHSSDQKESIIMGLRDDIKELQDQLESGRNVTTQHQNLNHYVAEKDSEIESLRQQVESMNAALHATRNRLASKEEEIDTLHGTLQRLQNDQKQNTEDLLHAIENSSDMTDDVDTLHTHVVSLAVALERSETRRAEAIDRLLAERQANADSLRRLSESVKRYYSAVAFGDH